MIVCLSLEWFENENALAHFVANVVEPALPAPNEKVELCDGSMH